MMLAEPIQITQRITQLLERLGLRYFIGGSLASSLHGIPRATQDVDIVTEIQEDHIDLLVKALEGEFYIEASMIREAIHRQASFNVIHLGSMFKVDIFILKSDAPSKEEMTRRERYQVSDDPLQRLFLASAEDVILHKLYWYQLGGCIAQRQWDDVLGVLQVQAERLDSAYLMKGARERGVAELLERALQEAQLLE